MIHADIDVSGRLQARNGHGEEAQFDLGRRQLGGRDAPLLLGHGGQLCVGIQGETIRAAGNHCVQHPLKARDALPGQPVDQINVDG